MINNLKLLRRWWSFYKSIKKDGLAIKAKWFNHLPIYDEKDLPIDFVTYDYPQCINYTFLKVEPKELDQFEISPLTTNFSLEIQKYDENNNVSQEDFFDYQLEIDNKSNIGLINKHSLYSMLIDSFKEMTSHLKGHRTIEEINDIRLHFTNKGTDSEYKKYKKTLKEIPNQD